MPRRLCLCRGGYKSHSLRLCELIHRASGLAQMIDATVPQNAIPATIMNPTPLIHATTI